MRRCGSRASRTKFSERAFQKTICHSDAGPDTKRPLANNQPEKHMAKGNNSQKKEVKKLKKEKPKAAPPTRRGA